MDNVFSQNEYSSYTNLYGEITRWGQIINLEDAPLVYAGSPGPIVSPKKGDGGVYYSERNAVLVGPEESCFVCEYLYSYTKPVDITWEGPLPQGVYRGSFRITINKESRSLLEDIIRKRGIFLITNPQKGQTTILPNQLGKYFKKHPGFFLPLTEIEKILFSRDYLQLLE